MRVKPKKSLLSVLLIFICVFSNGQTNKEIMSHSFNSGETTLRNELNEEITVFHLDEEVLTRENTIFKVSKNTSADSTFVHVVFFWLKNPDNFDERRQFETSIGKFIKNSKYVKSMHLGLPASTNRPVIDTTYTYCLIVSFSTKDEHDKYQAEEIHKIFIKESEDLWEKVRIYDSVNIW